MSHGPGRGTFRRFLVRQSVGGRTAAQRKACQACLVDKHAFEAAYARVLAEHGAQRGPVTDFFDWLLANSDKIIALVQKIIALFP